MTLLSPAASPGARPSVLSPWPARHSLAGGGAALGLSAARSRRHGAVGETGRVAGARISQRGSELVRGPGGDVHGQPFGLVAEPVALLGLDQRDREPAQWSTTADTEDLPLARWQDGPALGCRSAAHDRTEFPQDYGLPGSLDAESSFGSEQSSCSTGGGLE